MKLTPPKKVTFWISVLMVVLGVAASVLPLGVVSIYSTGIIVMGFVVLALGNMLKGL
jgi:threonine/homoserine/homoserine lactone efflux protein